MTKLSCSVILIQIDTNYYQVNEMDVSRFAQMLGDKAFFDLKKMRYKYPESFDGFLKALKEIYAKPLPLFGQNGIPLVYLDHYVGVDFRSVKLLLRPQSERYGVKAAEDEILSSSAIESIDFSRDSIRSILTGLAPRDEAETRILGQKKGLEFIANPANRITEENLHLLYQMMVGDFLPVEERLPEGAFYRNDAVYVVSDRVEHTGIDSHQLPGCMRALMAFIDREDGINELLKASMIHFYLAYLHPYFDGNGRMARMVHLWFLIQKGYQTALFVPFSSLIAASRKEYYAAFTAVEENSRISSVLDVTPFLKYITEKVYNQLPQSVVDMDTLSLYQDAVKEGRITPKEASLWRFVLSNYGSAEFSTKQLERDYRDVAYGTIRNFVQKFHSLGLLENSVHGNRNRYRVQASQLK